MIRLDDHIVDENEILLVDPNRGTRLLIHLKNGTIFAIPVKTPVDENKKKMIDIIWNSLESEGEKEDVYFERWLKNLEKRREEGRERKIRKEENDGRSEI